MNEAYSLRTTGTSCHRAFLTAYAIEETFYDIKLYDMSASS